MLEYSIVIPVYNSGKWIKKLIKEIIDVMDNTSNYGYEIILVNDSSPEIETWTKLKEVCETYDNITIIDLQYNVGQLNALMCGLQYANGDYIITMDDDFQHNPHEIPKFISKIKNSEYDCVIGEYDQKKHGYIRRLGSKLSNKLSEKIYNKPTEITSNSFRIINRKTVDALLKYKGKKPQIGPMLFSITNKITTVPIRHEERVYGKSGYKMKKLISETLNVIINASTFPLDIVSIGGFIVALASFIIGGVYFVSYFLGNISVQGFTAQILVTTCMSGLIMLSIGVVGKYIGRVVHELVGFPAYIEREVINSYEIKKEKM